VFFRVACAARARELELRGHVRNLRDGRVEAAFEGEDAAVDAMVAWCRGGPELARVDGIEVVDESLRGDASFRVSG